MRRAPARCRSSRWPSAGRPRRRAAQKGATTSERRERRRDARHARGSWVPGADESASTHGWAGRGAVGGWDPVALTLMRRPFADAPPPARLRARLYFVNELLDDGVHLRLEPRVGGEGVARGACARARCGDGHRQRLVHSRADRRGAIEATQKVARPRLLSHLGGRIVHGRSFWSSSGGVSYKKNRARV